MNTSIPSCRLSRCCARRTGLPHRIILDEAHYFLQDPDSQRLLDLELSGYTLVTYRASSLCASALASVQAALVTRESDPDEIKSLGGYCASCTLRSEEEWNTLFRNLSIGEAAALPITDEAGGDVRRIHLSPRLTPHVRHLAKYIDVPVTESHAFVFWSGTSATAEHAHTLREFVDILASKPLAEFDGHLRRKDFSRWITGVFGDYQLGKAVSDIEEDYRLGHASAATRDIILEIQTRYELAQADGGQLYVLPSDTASAPNAAAGTPLAAERAASAA